MIDETFFRTELEGERVRIINDLKGIAVFNQHTGDWEAITETDEADSADDNLGADALEALEERLATLSALEITYNDIERALRKLNEGGYGICEICDRTIEEDRLNALPTARTCTQHMDQEDLLSL